MILLLLCRLIKSHSERDFKVACLYDRTLVGSELFGVVEKQPFRSLPFGTTSVAQAASSASMNVDISVGHPPLDHYLTATSKQRPPWQPQMHLTLLPLPTIWDKSI